MQKSEQLEPNDPFVLESCRIANRAAINIVTRLGFDDLRSAAVDPDNRSIVEKSFAFDVDEMGEVFVMSEFDSPIGLIFLRFSLSRIAFDIVHLMRTVLGSHYGESVFDSGVVKILKKKSIDVYKLLNLSKGDSCDPLVGEHAEKALVLFIENLPFFARSTVIDSLGHSKLGYVQNYLRVELEDHWKDLGLPKKFSLITIEQLEEVRKYDVRHRHWFLGDRKAYLDLTTLHILADSLHARYKEYIADAKETEASFHRTNRRASEDDWDAFWTERVSEDYGDLHPRALREFKKNRGAIASNLRDIHLGAIYDYSPEVIREKISESRSLNNSPRLRKSKKLR